MAWWGPIVYETYGGTEVGMATVATPEDWLAHPGSVGVPTLGTRMAFYSENGELAPDGEPGEIYMRVPAYADFTYLNNPEKRQDVERDGLISVGDVGYLKNGRLYLCDRRSDMVISGGTNIYPAEIEMALTQCPGVQDCAVFGIPDDDFGESLAAAVELMPGAQVTVLEIQAFWKRAWRNTKCRGALIFMRPCRARTAERFSSGACVTFSGRRPGARSEAGEWPPHSPCFAWSTALEGAFSSWDGPAMKKGARAPKCLNRLTVYCSLMSFSRTILPHC